MIFVYTTCADREESKMIGSQLIKDRLVSCFNYWECDSVYQADGELKDAKESILLCKTEDVLFGQVREKIAELHSYQLPAIGAIPVNFNEEYDTWMARFLR